MQSGDVIGAKIRVSGRLDGGEMSRTEWLSKGRMPLATLRAHIDYATANAYCTYGVVGIKVWIYKGDVFDKKIKRRYKIDHEYVIAKESKTQEMAQRTKTRPRRGIARHSFELW